MHNFAGKLKIFIMKKLTLLFSALFVAVLLNAQSNKEEVDFYQSIFGMEKKAVVAEFVKVTDAQKDAFWTLYDEYETARKELGKERISLLEDYAQNWDKMTAEKADALAAEIMKISDTTDKLIISYYKKIKKISDPIVAFQFYQIENYILTAIRMQILDSIPFPEAKQ